MEVQKRENYSKDKTNTPSLLTGEERGRILYDFNNSEMAYPKNKVIHELFEEQVKKTSDNTAIVGPSLAAALYEVSLTYTILNEEANHLAGLLKQKGVEPDTIVAVIVDPSIEMIVGILGILKAGGAYLPISPEYPDVRKQYMLKESSAKVLLTNHRLFEDGEKYGNLGVETIFVEEIGPGLGVRYAVPEPTPPFGHPSKEGIYQSRGEPCVRPTMYSPDLSDQECRGESMYSPEKAQSESYQKLRSAPCALCSASSSKNLAYVIYTSGSTGKPKGVMVDHGSTVNLLFSLFDAYPTSPVDSYLLITSYIFDVSVVELFCWFLGGSKLVIMGKDERKEPQRIIEKVESAKITHINFAPSMFNAVLEVLNNQDVGKISSLKYIFLAGEALLAGLVSKFMKLGSNAILENLYGPTEGTVYASGYSLQDWGGKGSIPIGKPLHNVKLYIFDDKDNLQPIGVPGELAISGAGLARGYLNNPELTAEKFITEFRIQNSEARMHLKNSEGLASGGQLFEKSWTKTSADSNIPSFHHSIIPSAERSGAKLYRTGDLAQWLPDGNMDFLGRLDHQVKLRGLRIELGEIESCLLTHEKVKEAVVVARDNEAGEKYLCAYIVTKSAERVGGNLVFPPDLDREIDDVGARRAVPSDFREFLSRNLPDYMIPSFFVLLEELPLTPSGKVDRKSLPEPRKESGVKYIAPRDRMEEKLVEIWSKALGVEKEKIGIDDNFFALGGHSLNGTIVINAVHKEFNVRMSLEEIFEIPKISKISRYIKEAAEDKYIPIEAVEEKDYYELSYAQRRLWILCQFEEESTAYNMPFAFVLSGKLDIDVFNRALQSLIDRHESLRTLFISAAGEPRQRIIKNLKCNLEFVDLRDMGAEAKEMKAREIFLADANRVFDLEKGPLFLFKLVRLKDEEYLWILNIHHIVNDGWSQSIINNEISSVYNAFLKNKENPLQPVKLQYRDYTLWHNELIKSDHFLEAEKYWLEKFKDKPNGIELPLDFSRKPVQTFNGGRVSFDINEAKTKNLHQLCFAEDATLFMGLLSLLSILLYKYTGQRDIIIGLPIAGRRRQELDEIVGFLVNTLVFRNNLEPGDSFKELVKSIKQETLDCYENQDYPFDILIEKLELQRDLSQSPVFNVMLAYYNADTGDSSPGMEAVTKADYPYYYDFDMSKFDLIFFMDEIDNHISVMLEYNSDLFERGTIERMSENLVTLLEHIIEDAAVPISALKCIGSAEYKKVVEDFNDNRGEFPSISIQELFENQVKKSGDKDAVIFNREKITYKALNEKVNQFAHYLREVYNVKPNDVIGISMDRSLDMIIVLLGILKSGAAYLALDPTYPKDRLLHVLGDSQSIILVFDKMRPELFTGYQGKFLDINEHRDKIASHSKENPEVVNEPSDILYVNYTSGSTGTPNGAMLSHDCLTNLVHWQNEKTSIDCSLRVLQFTSINFCVSFQEIMGSLTSGGELHLIGDVERQDIDYLMDFLSEHQIEVLFLPFSYLNFIFNESSRWNRSFKHNLKHIITAGEQLKMTIGLKRFLDLHPVIQLHNHYGSTEMHVVTSYTLDASTADKTPIPPAGKPISNVKIYILDDYFNPVPIGVWGELYVKGSSGVLGYINNSALNEKKLLNHPELSSDKNRLYRSGDIGRWHEDGNIELRGRKDSQVKIRGFRIEPGEIESKILSIKGVRECVVVVKEEKKNQKYLVAYIVIENLEVAGIKGILNSILPQYMIPRFVVLESLPLMPNGKVDRDKLPEPETVPEDEYIAPRNEVEGKLVEIWAGILSLEKKIISIDANFFDLGGHSLKATVMTSRIQKELNVRVPLTEIFKAPTISEIAAYITKEAAREEYSPILPANEQEYYPLSPSQKRLYIVQQTNLNNTSYNMPVALVLAGKLNRGKLAGVFKELVKRHESFRTSFRLIEDSPVQRIHEPDDIEFKIEYYSAERKAQRTEPVGANLVFARDAEHGQQIVGARGAVPAGIPSPGGVPLKGRGGLEPAGGSLQSVTSIIEDFVRPFDLTRAPLLRVKLIKEEEEKYILMIDMHHIISDGVSFAIFFKELEALYNGEHLPSLKLQYKDYSQWQNSEKQKKARRQHEAYWLKEFAGDLPQLKLPLDYKRSESFTYEGDNVCFCIGKEKREAMLEFAIREDVTLFMVLLSVFYILLAKMCQQDDIVIGIPTAGRRHADLQEIIGMFVNPLPMRNYPRGKKTYMEFLKELKERALQAFENQNYQYEELVERLEVNRDSGRTELFNVMFTLQNLGERSESYLEMELPGIKSEPYENIVNKVSKFDLTFYAYEERDRIDCVFEYSTQLFSEVTVEIMRDRYLLLLDNVLRDAACKIENLNYKTAIEEELSDVTEVEFDF